MTCAHIVDVALKKVAGVDSVDVSLNKGLATVKLKPGNTVSVFQLWQLLHREGYTPKATKVTVRGELGNAQGRLALQVSGGKEILALIADPKNTAAFSAAAKKLGQTVVIQGTMTPGKDLKASAPLEVGAVN